jgi:hypothetical protein
VIFRRRDEHSECGWHLLPPDVSDNLRFEIGNAVLCNTEDGWEECTIECVGHVIETGQYATYSARKTSCGHDLMVPFDNDNYIRRCSKLVSALPLFHNIKDPEFL